MQKKFFILLAALILILLLAVWAYLFLNSTGETADDLFAELGLEGEPLPSMVPPDTNQSASSSINMERAKLRQLTTKPVAGFGEVLASASSSPVIYYAERGTGHIYTIDPISGKEERVSGTTFAQAEQAVFSFDGKYVAISTASNNKAKPLTVSSISTSTRSVTELFTESVTDFSLTSDNYAVYSTPGTQGAVGYKHNLVTGQKSNLFSLPFFEARVQWGSVSTDPLYIYPKPTYALEGFLYEVTGGTLQRLPTSGFGFSAIANADMVVFNAASDNGPQGYIYDRDSGETRTMLAPVLPDKCFLEAVGYEFICGHEASKPVFTYPDSWYQGSISYKDTLYQLNGELMQGESLVDTFITSGRELDIINLHQSTDQTTLYFINKNDQTLWMYEK